ncbi:MAG TPA: hypothetical protein VHZ02_18890 [Acidimicrobiales bacterium]|nr:hypothetical protein [Acidimicrobiales bacterium]
MRDRRGGLREPDGSKSNTSDYRAGPDIGGIHHDPSTDHHDHGAADHNDHGPAHHDGSAPHRPSDHRTAADCPSHHRTPSSGGNRLQLHAVERRWKLLPTR